MTKEQVLELAEEYEVDFMFMDGYDDCIEGILERFGQPPIVCYNKTKVLAKLIKDGMTPEEADEFFSFNQIGAWIGVLTPCFITI